jgi:transcriptional regulator with XRE-family HTH domain
MGSVESPVVARRRVRLALRKAREAKGLTQGQVADALEWSLSKVNRIEGGDVAVSNTDLRAMLELFDVTDAATVTRLIDDARASRRRGWWDEPSYREHLTAATLHLLQYESEATTIRAFQPTLIPGLLQSRAYAESVLGYWRDDVPDDALAARLEVRLRRAQQVLDKPDPPKYLVVIDESAVWREVGGRRIMAEQLQELLTRVSGPKVTVRILPFTDGGPMAQMGAFTLFDLGDEENAVLYRESLNSDDVVHSSTVIRRHRQYFEQMWDLSLDDEASERLIRARVATLLASLDRGAGQS